MIARDAIHCSYHKRVQSPLTFPVSCFLLGLVGGGDAFVNFSVIEVRRPH